MKTPRERYEEQHGIPKTPVPGGKAGARQRQFEQERGIAPPTDESKDQDGNCSTDEKGDQP